MSIHLPASQLLQTNRSSAQSAQSEGFLVQSTDQENLYAVRVQTENLISLRPGLLADFINVPTAQPIATGVIQTIFPQQEQVLVKTSTSVQLTTSTRIKFRRAIELAIQPTTLVNPVCFIATPQRTATLSAYAKVANDHVAGFLSWSLFYQQTLEADYVLCVKGHDKDSFAECSFQHSGQWAAGHYLVIAERFHWKYRVSAAIDRRSWVLTSPASTLACGRPCDHLPPLHL